MGQNLPKLDVRVRSALHRIANKSRASYYVSEGPKENLYADGPHAAVEGYIFR
jgi:hypothetical protein